MPCEGIGPMSETRIEYAVRAPGAIGDLTLGMSRDEVRRLLGEPEYSEAAHEKWGISFPEKDCFYENCLQIRYDAELRSEDIQFSASPRFVVTFDSVPVLESTAAEIARVIELKCPVDRREKEFPVIYSYPELGVSLWRAGKDDEHFATINLTMPWPRTDGGPG